MISVKTKPQTELPIQAVRQRTTFQVLSRTSRGETGGAITLAVPLAGKITADGNEIKHAKVSARADSRVTLEVELKPAAKPL